FQYTARCLATDSRELTLQLAHASLSGISGDNQAHDCLRNLDLIGSQPVFAQDFGQDMAHPNVDFFIQRITGQIDDIHAVEQWTWNLVFNIASTNEKHFGKIKGNFQVVIHEIVVLFRVEYFQQSRRRISAILRGELIHLVQQDNRIAHTDRLHGLNNAARQSPNIGAPMPANLRLIVDTTQRDT